jgi:hypothetical protein
MLDAIITLFYRRGTFLLTEELRDLSNIPENVRWQSWIIWFQSQSSVIWERASPMVQDLLPIHLLTHSTNIYDPPITCRLYGKLGDTVWKTPRWVAVIWGTENTLPLLHGPRQIALHSGPRSPIAHSSPSSSSVSYQIKLSYWRFSLFYIQTLNFPSLFPICAQLSEEKSLFCTLTYRCKDVNNDVSM